MKRKLMRKIVHLVRPALRARRRGAVGAAGEAVNAARPTLVVVSGDLTQRARTHQFEEARAFLDRLPKPQIVVPGNHDVPLYDVYSRFARPLDKWRRFISDDLEPFYEDEEMIVAGVNTARSLTRKYGRVNEEQVARLRERLCTYPDEVFKVIVTHHPFDLPEGADEREIVGRARWRWRRSPPAAQTSCSRATCTSARRAAPPSATRFKVTRRSTCRRARPPRHAARGEANSFNVIRLKHPHIQVERRVWHPGARTFRLGQRRDLPPHSRRAGSVSPKRSPPAVTFDETARHGGLRTGLTKD
jgi:hypothetical protein